jgi:hypothetical protein
MDAKTDGCKCSFRIRMVGDGCRYCQPQEYIDRLHDNAKDDQEEIDRQAAQIADLTADRDSWRDQASQRVKDWDDMRQERDKALARVGELEADAEMWRTLKWIASDPDFELMIDAGGFALLIATVEQHRAAAAQGGR